MPLKALACCIAQGIKARLREVAPTCTVIERFLGAQELAWLYTRARLNIHPALHDAYGMTVVEAAAQVTQTS
jgi:hypothetical protein